MVKLNSKIKAATLMESLIAMVIIVVCFAIATRVYVNVLNSDKQNIKLKALLLLNVEAETTKKTKLFVDYEKQIDLLKIVQRIEKYGESGEIHKLSLSAFNAEGKLIYTHNELILNEN